MSATTGMFEAFVIAFIALVASTSGQEPRTMSAPLSSRARVWSMVARASPVTVFVIVCTLIGASPPTGTLPTMICRDLRRWMSRYARRLILLPLPSIITVGDGLGIQRETVAHLAVLARRPHRHAVEIDLHGAGVARRQRHADHIGHHIGVARVQRAVDEYPAVGTLHQNLRRLLDAQDHARVPVLLAIDLARRDRGLLLRRIG